MKFGIKPGSLKVRLWVSRTKDPTRDGVAKPKYALPSMTPLSRIFSIDQLNQKQNLRQSEMM